jgi:hypothetical protein
MLQYYRTDPLQYCQTEPLQHYQTSRYGIIGLNGYSMIELDIALLPYYPLQHYRTSHYSIIGLDVTVLSD